MFFDGLIVFVLAMIRGMINLLPTMEFPAFLDLSGLNIDLSLVAYFIPLDLFSDILGFLILYFTAKWSVKLMEIILHRKILP